MSRTSMTDAEQRILKDYISLMSEAKVRLSCVYTLFRDSRPYPQGIAKEFCFLQLRMTCELIALGCLVAHGDLKETQSGRLRKEYSADKIMWELGKMHPEFFPHAIEMYAGDDGSPKIRDAPPGYLTKDELLELNGLCGAVLHRGSITRVQTKKRIAKTDKDATKVWADKLRMLLQEHMIAMVGLQKVIVCRMTGSPTKDVATFLLVSSE